MQYEHTRFGLTVPFPIGDDIIVMLVCKYFIFTLVMLKSWSVKHVWKSEIYLYLG